MVLVRVTSNTKFSAFYRKYKMFFIFGAAVLCAQVYLAYLFFMLETDVQESFHYASDKADVSHLQENEGLPQGTRQLKLPPDKQRLQNKSHNRLAKPKLDVKTLNFTPTCEITGREAVSAVTRAQTQICKEQIVNITCLAQKNALYPEKLASSCPHSPGFAESPKSLGCFKDDKNLRLLPGHYAVLKYNNSPANCAYICLQSGYPFAGVEYSVDCFCGTEEPSRIKRLPDSSCSMKCSGDQKQSCGGYLTINVLSTGIQRFKAQEARNTSVANNNQKPVRIAFLLTVNGRASRQVKRLISMLYHPSHLFYIHVDARQDFMYREMLAVEKRCKSGNIVVAKENSRHASIWGGASLLTTVLDSARHMLAHNVHWDYLINLSESDFPVKSNQRLVEFLTWNKGYNFVKSHGREVQRFISKQGLDKTFVECEARMWRVGDRKLPNGIQIDGGSDWVALSRDFVEFIANPEPDPLISGLLQIFRLTLLPAESFFHTVLRNSRFCDTYVDNNLHVTNWKRKLGCKCQYKVVVDWCGCSPNDFKLEDFGRIRNTAERNLFFARKFEPVVDQRIVDRVEHWLYPERANASLTSKGYDKYWQSLYHHADRSPIPDDVLLTIADSLTRLTFLDLGLVGGAVRVMEVHAHFRGNGFHGILVKGKAKIAHLESSTLDFPEEVEALVRLRERFVASRQWLGKILRFLVGTDYDQKEQMFRNFYSGLGPLSAPGLAYEFDQSLSTPVNVSVLWVDPLGRLADVNQFLVEEMSLSGHVHSHFSENLVTGKWHLLLVSNDEIVAKSTFVVVPLAYWKNKNITLKKAKELHSTFQGHYKNVDDKWRQFLKSSGYGEPEGTQESDVENLMRSQLHRHIDALISEQYEIKKVCAVKSKNKSKSSMLKCESTDWSSESPDEKSDIQNLCRRL